MKQHCVTIVGAGQIVEEFRAIEELGITDVQIYDDTFTWSKKRVLDICTGLIDNNIKVNTLVGIDPSLHSNAEIQKIENIVRKKSSNK